VEGEEEEDSRKREEELREREGKEKKKFRELDERSEGPIFFLQALSI